MNMFCVFLYSVNILNLCIVLIFVCVILIKFFKFVLIFLKVEFEINCIEVIYLKSKFCYFCSNN